MARGLRVNELFADIGQVLVIAKHEARKHIQTKRFYTLAIIALSSVLFAYSLPLLSGESYSGHYSEEQIASSLVTDAHPGYHSYIWLFHSDVVSDSIVVSMNGTDLSASEWTCIIDQAAIIYFKSDYGLMAVSVSYRYAMKATDLAENMILPLPFVIGFCAVVVGADAIIGEIQSRTAYILFPNPIRRASILYGKILAGATVSSLVLLVFFLVISLLSWLSVGSIARYLYLSLGFAFLYLMMCLMMTYAISAVSRTTVEALAASLLLLLLVFPSTQAAEASAGLDGWYLPSFAADTMKYSLSWDHYPQDVTMNTSVPIYYPEPALSALVLVAYCAVFTAISAMCFSRRELVGFG